MKKIFILGFVMLQCLMMQAQDWKFSVGAGANFNGPAGETLVDGNRFGYHLGGTAQYEFSQQSSWYLSGSLFWTQKGYKVKTDILDVSKPEPKSFRGKVSTDITYLQIPIFVGKNFDLGERTKLFVELGPYASLALFGKETVAGHSPSVPACRLPTIIASNWATSTGLQTCGMAKIPAIITETSRSPWAIPSKKSRLCLR